MSHAAAGTIERPRRYARLLAYSRWQALDFTINIVVVTLLLFGLLGAIAIMNIHAMEEVSRGHGVSAVIKLENFMQMWGMFAAVGPIIAVSGVASQDRNGGYSRFLFAKPLSPRLFYFQSWLIRFAGFLLIGFVLVFAYSMYEPPAFDWRFVVDMAAAFASIGGMIFLLSVISRFDAVIGAAFLLIADVVWSKWEGVHGVKHAAIYLFPPISHLGAPHNWLLGLNTIDKLADVPFPTKWVAWNVGYGLACLLLGVYLLRKVSLTKA